MKAPLDPPRLIDSDDADPVLRQALRVIRSDAPSITALGALADGAERVLRHGTPRAAASAAATPFAAKLVIATIAGGAIAYSGLPAARSFVEGAPHKGSSRSEVAASSPATKAPAPAAPVAEAPDPVEGAPLAAVPPTRGPSRSIAEPPEHRASEVDLLEEAQQALGREPRRALALLAEHRRVYAHGKFSQEREVLMLEAFARLHDTAALRSGARAFLARYPRSPHRARVDRLLEGLEH